MRPKSKTSYYVTSFGMGDIWHQEGKWVHGHLPGRAADSDSIHHTKKEAFKSARELERLLDSLGIEPDIEVMRLSYKNRKRRMAIWRIK